MELRTSAVLLLLVICSPCKFIRSPTDVDVGPLSLIQPSRSASRDFGMIVSMPPYAVLQPTSGEDIALLLASLSASPFAGPTVAARGAGHSLRGQAQALDGIVVDMRSFRADIKIFKHVNRGCGGHADVGGGALWAELLEESLKHGMAPRSWTDYLDLTIGGTLSNGGVSGQTFKHGPQISNVLQLEVVTGKGDMLTCSQTKNTELFHAVLGGLGQFGIITKARILLQEAPQRVRWYRAFYDDFRTFTADQELLISMPELVDYVEGFMVLNEQSLHSSSVAFPANIDFKPEFISNGKYNVYYCIEFAVHVYLNNEDDAVLENDNVSRLLSHIPSQMYSVEVSYFDFLNRVRMEELSLRDRELWDVPHPWLNLFVPKSGIMEFRDLLVDNISPNDFEGPVLIYPLLKNKWDNNTSAVIPAGEDQVMYIVGLLKSANPAHCSQACLDEILARHSAVADGATRSSIGAKQYLGWQPSPAHWWDHFGPGWVQFAARKAQFDPLHILAPGQGIFARTSTYDA